MKHYDPSESIHPFNESILISDDLRELAQREQFRGTDYGAAASDGAQALYDLRGMLQILSEAALWAFEFCYHRDVMNAKVLCAPVHYSPITERLAIAIVEVIHGCDEAEQVVAQARQAF